ncbi:long-chain-alcohol oxidase [Sarracenia purpurea var. burkii]
MEKTSAEYAANSQAENEREERIVIELGSMESERALHGGERRSQVQPLSSGQMESLAALCDTFLPSIDICNEAVDADYVAFYRTSASMAGTSQRVEELITERMHHPKLFLMRLSLWLLATWIGTFILCGKASLDSHFPYFQRFSKVSQKKREEIMRLWSNSFFPLLRMLFLAMKLLSLLAFFTQVRATQFCYTSLLYLFYHEKKR